MWKNEDEYWEEFYNWIGQFRDDFEGRPEDCWRFDATITNGVINE